MSASKKDIESQLLGEEALKAVSVQALELADQMDEGSEGTLFFNEDGSISRHSKETKKLEGMEAMRFLNLPPRPYNRLRVGDVSLIRQKFGDFFERLIKENKPKRNENRLFWDQIRVRVIKKSEAGKSTRGCPSAGIEPGIYNGDIFTGEAFKAFLPESRRSNAENDYILLLLSVVVTEELENV